MGLDILLYDHEGDLIKRLEISASLHHHIFEETEVWSSYLTLRKIRDYYRTHVTWEQEEIKRFLIDLERVSPVFKS